MTHNYNIQSQKFPLFKSVKNKKSNEKTTLPALIGDIRGGKWKSQVEPVIKFGTAKKKTEADELKIKLPGFTISSDGVEKDAKSLETSKHTGFLMIDLDAEENPGVDFPKFIDAFKADPHILAGFRSPSGTGYKLVVLIEPCMETHKSYFGSALEYFQQNYKLEIDLHCSNVNRLCFVSYDPDAWLTLEQVEPLPLTKIVAAAAIQEKPVKPSIVPVVTSKSTSGGKTLVELAQNNERRKKWKKEFKEKCPRLASHYDKFVRTPTSDFKKGTRHHESVKLINFLFEAVTPKLIEIFLAQFWLENQENIKATKDEHMKECRSLIDSVSLNYLKTLNADGIRYYRSLDEDEDEQCAFRICRSLASLPKMEGGFFLSKNELSKRLAITINSCKSIFNNFLKDGIFTLLKAGTQGENGIASTYTWNSSLIPLCHAVEPVS